MGVERPGRPVRGDIQHGDLVGRESVEYRPVREVRTLLDAGAGPDDGLSADPAEVADDRGGFDDGAGAEVAAVDHRAGPDDDVVLDDELVVGQQVQYGVLQNLHPGADPYRAVAVSDDLHAGADDRALCPI